MIICSKQVCISHSVRTKKARSRFKHAVTTDRNAPYAVLLRPDGAGVIYFGRERKLPDHGEEKFIGVLKYCRKHVWGLWRSFLKENDVIIWRVSRPKRLFDSLISAWIISKMEYYCCCVLVSGQRLEVVWCRVEFLFQQECEGLLV